MNTNCFFERGTSHDVCQDYALSGNINANIAYLLISDGCTASHEISKQVDLGARILLHCAQKYLLQRLTPEFNLSRINKDEFGTELADNIINDAYFVAKHLKLSAFSLDCTLIAAISDAERSFVFMFGDGGLIVHQSNGNIYYTEVTFLSGAPYYLSYRLDPLRQAGYSQEYGDSGVIISNYEFRTPDEEPIVHNEVDNSHINRCLYAKTAFEIKGAQVISIVSDGIKSFQKTAASDIVNIPSQNMVMHFAGFKNVHGNFVERRIHAMKRQLEKENVTHYDDTSIASVAM